MSLLDFLDKIDTILNTVDNVLGVNEEKSDDQQQKTTYTENINHVEKSIPAPRLFDKDGRLIPPDLHIRR